MAKKPKLGSGARFEALVQKIMKEKGYNRKQAEAVAASAGRAKYGQKKMTRMSVAGKKRRSRIK